MISQDDNSISNENYGTSASKVFAIPELLEEILLLLQPEDILISQRVGRAWRQAIDGSKRLRQALFIDPEPAEFAWFSFEGTEDITVHDFTLFKVGKLHVTQISAEELSHSNYVPTHRHSLSVKARLNTLLHDRGHWKEMTLSDRIERGEGLRLGRTKSKILGYGRQMFLTQPPCKEVSIWTDWGQPKTVYNEDGVRFWQVLEVTEGVETTAYLPHMFMLAKGVIALTEAEDETFAEVLREKRESWVKMKELGCYEICCRRWRGMDPVG